MRENSICLPEKITKPVSLEVEGSLQPKFKEMATSGMNKIIIDLTKVTEINVSLLKLIILIIQSCQKSNIKPRVVGGSTASNGLKEFQETSALEIDGTIDQAKAAL